MEEAKDIPEVQELCKNKKRSADQTADEATTVKKAKLSALNLLDLSDCVLSEILSYIDAYNLFVLSCTHPRFKYLITERKLWKVVDIRRQSICAQKFQFFFQYLNEYTSQLILKGIHCLEKCLTLNQLRKLPEICPNLTVLALENQMLNSMECTIVDFPTSLQELSLKSAELYGRVAFFKDVQLNLPNLHTLILDHCIWVHEHYLIAISKLENLENLSLYGCENLCDSIAYMSMITKNKGFKKLMRIDARRTNVGNEFMRCFQGLRSLQEIYLEALPQNQRSGRSPFPFSPVPIDPEIKQLIKFSCYRCRDACRTCTLEYCTLIPDDVESLEYNSSDEQVTEETRTLTQVKHLPALPLTPNSETPPTEPELLYTKDYPRNHLRVGDSYTPISDRSFHWYHMCLPGNTTHQGMKSVLFGPIDPTIPRVRKPKKEKPKKTKSGWVSDDEVFEDRRSYVGSACVSDDELFNDRRSNLAITRIREDDENSELYRPRKRPKRTYDAHFLRYYTSRGQTSLPSTHFGPSSSQYRSGHVIRSGENFRFFISHRLLGMGVDERPCAEEIPHRGDGRYGLYNLIPAIVVEPFAGEHPEQLRQNAFQIRRLEDADPKNETNLKIMVARGYEGISDIGLAYLNAINLKVLDLTGSSITAEGVQSFHLINPDCVLIHDKFNEA